MHGRPQLQMNLASFTSHPVADVNRILPVGHDKALLQRDAFDLIDPNRQTALDAELLEVLGAREVHLSVGTLNAAEPDAPAIGELNGFDEIVEHHSAAERRR